MVYGTYFVCYSGLRFMFLLVLERKETSQSFIYIFAEDTFSQFW